MQARIRQACLFAVVACGLVVLLGGAAFAQSSNSMIGTWKINLATSKYSAGKAPKSAAFTVEAAGAGFKVKVDSVSADGTVAKWAYSASYDGKDNPITGNCAYGDIVAATRLDANTTRYIYKKGGKVTVTQTHTVSSDGKMDTIAGTGTNAAGQTVNSVVVYDKQ
ncbi:MAG: hypothetical protein WCP29_05250 [Acidobacteriota bacterium]